MAQHVVSEEGISTGSDKVLEPSIGASHQISVHFGKAVSRCLEIDQSKTRIACGGHVC